MQKLGLSQSLSQKLSPQQIQFIKLLQIPTAELETRIEAELETNPVLEEGNESPTDEYEMNDSPDDEYSQDDEISLEDYIPDDDFAGYKMQGSQFNPDSEDKEIPVPTTISLTDQLISQLGFLGLDERSYTIGKQLIGSIESDGYIRRTIAAIANDLAFSQNIEASVEEIEAVLKMIQLFDPPGIGARGLQECLLIQLERKEEEEPAVFLAKQIILRCFDEFTKKHYDKIIKKLNIKKEGDLKDAVTLITKLNPKPGGAASGLAKVQYLIPDFILKNNNGKLELSLNSLNAPDLKISRSYSEMIEAYDKSNKKDKKLKETVTFVKQKLDAAKWFIDAIKQRQHTLLNTMNAIVSRQYDFFIDGNESKLKPMILKDIADEISMDISTISRVANSKSVQTEFGIFPLKYFFSEAISTESGEDVSSREVKHVLKQLIEDEDKKKPLSDEKLEKLLKDKGYNIARRTVAKYREQMHIPVARLRKELL